MAAQLKRKGFKISKNTEVLTDNVDFDELDKSTPKRKSSTQIANDRSSLSRRKLSTDAGDVRKSAKSKRSKYPDISYSTGSLKVDDVHTLSGAEQFKVLKRVVENICSHEADGLLAHLNSGGHTELSSALEGVLGELSATVAGGLVNTSFRPEFSKEARAEIGALVAERDSLRSYYQRLVELESSPSQLGTEFDLWLSPEKAQKRRSDVLKEKPGQKSNGLEKFVAEYGELVRTLETGCDEIKNGRDELRDQVTASTKAQEVVYTVFNTARQDSSASSSNHAATVPTDARDIIKHLSANPK